MTHSGIASRAHNEVPAGLAEAIEIVGGGAALARAIGVTRFAVQQWKDTGIPAARVPAVARVTGIPLHKLRPDLFDAPPHQMRAPADAIERANDDAEQRGATVTRAPARHRRTREAA